MTESKSVMGATALARALGISRQMVYQYTIEGKITANDGKYDIERVRAELANNLGFKKGGVPRRGERMADAPIDSNNPRLPNQSAGDAPVAVPVKAPGRDVAKVDLEKLALGERIRRDKIRNDLDEDKLLEAEEVRAAVTEMIVHAVNKLTVIGEELMERLAIEQEPQRCRQLVDERIDQALAELFKYPCDAEHSIAA